jgi:rhamnosyltransferase
MLLSVIIPVKNGSKTLKNCLLSIKKQTLYFDAEIIILDSGSTDNSVEIAHNYGAKIININPSEFNHGSTRNLGASFANGKLLYYTVQDAELSDNNILEIMASHFNDSDVKAVVGIQGIQHDLNKNPALWFKRISSPEIEVRHFPGFSFFNLPKECQFRFSNWDNVNAMYRKEALLMLPFKQTNYSEDWQWAYEALQNGFKLIRDTSLLVFHYHHLTFSYVFRSNFIMNYQLFITFSQKPKLSFSILPIIKKIFTLIKRKELKIFKKIFWIFHNIISDFASLLSNLLLLLCIKVGGKNLLNKVYVILCKSVPQGSIMKE